MGIHAYFLGCPSWGFKPWTGLLYRSGSKPASYLEQYSSVFNAVEGNTTFYSTPLPAWVERWGETTPEDFRFCFKIPKQITHERRLRDAEAETKAFLERMAPLGPRLGPFMVQLPGSFGPDDLEALEGFLAILPAEFHYAVELRHTAFFDGGETEKRLDQILRQHGRVDRVIMDTRALRSGDGEHPEVQTARNRKPNMPVRMTVTGQSPVLRFVGHPEQGVNTQWLRGWVEPVAQWIRQGLHPYVFMHCPNDVHAPGMARAFHHMLGESLDAGTMAPWPGEEPGGQMRLF